jgi:hypothetical protein
MATASSLRALAARATVEIDNLFIEILLVKAITPVPAVVDDWSEVVGFAAVV